VLRGAHSSHCLQNLGADLLILALQIKHRNGVERLGHGLRGLRDRRLGGGWAGIGSLAAWRCSW
jgi:hypothetical protein